MPTIIFHQPELSESQLQTIEQTLGARPTPQKRSYQLNMIDDVNRKDLKKLSTELKIDINVLKDKFDPSQVKLLISDMDSTLIGIECVDEIADMMGLKPQVSEITEAAMRGELNFESSLRQRVQLLKGLPTDALQKVFDERLFLNPGAETWVTGLKEKGVAFALVSGGFTFFTDRLKEQLQLDFARSNQLAIENNTLTGTIDGTIIGAEAKAEFLHELCEKLNITPSQVIAIGDGANDLLMMKQAGLSIAYHAKPKVQEEAMTALNFSGLDAVLDFLNTIE